jgi:acyl-CoA thioester hydrolase
MKMAKPYYIEDLNEWKEGFKYRYPVRVRFSETDAFGHLNNTVSFVYFELGRINFFKDSGMTGEWFSSDGKTIPVTGDLHCDYFKQVFFDEELDVCVKVAEIGTTSVDLHYMIVNKNDDICMTGRGKIVQVSRDSGKPQPWSENGRNFLEKGM